MALSREQVVQTAIRLLQEVGLDGLTLRRLATELGISAPTLYWHVRDKRELLDLMAEGMIRAVRDKQPPLPETLSWDERIAEGMRRQYQAITAYRDGARVVAGNRPTDTALPEIEHYLQIWIDEGFPPDEALATILAFGDYITGAALEYQSERDRNTAKDGKERRQEIWAKMQQFPALAEAARLRAARAGQLSESFEHGLGLLMAGLRARHAELSAQRKGAASAMRPPQNPPPPPPQRK